MVGPVDPPFPSCDSDEENFLFVSYAHDDRGAVYEILVELQALGAKIWYDDGIPPGEPWARVIARALKNCSACIVMVSEQAMSSEDVASEVDLAVGHAKPILCVFLEQVELRDELEYHLRRKHALFRYDTDRDTFERRLRKFLERVPTAPSPGAAGPPPAPARQSRAGGRDRAAVDQVRAFGDVLPDTTVVDAQGAPGTHRSITTALAAVAPGGTVRIRPGYYEEELQVAKPVTILGEGEPGGVVVWSDDGEVVTWAASGGCLENLGLHQTGTGGRFSAIVVESGRLTLRACAVSSASANAVIASGDSEVTLARAQLRGSRIGLSALEGAVIRMEDCSVDDHQLYGAEIRKARATLVHDQFTHNGASGIFVGDGATATVDACRILENAGHGLEITSGAQVNVSGSAISANDGAGVGLTYMGKAKVVGNDLLGNRGGPVARLTGSRLDAWDNSTHDETVPGAGVRPPT